MTSRSLTATKNYKAMQNAGVDADAVLAKVGLDKSILSLPELRTPHDAQEWFWQAVQEVSGDPMVGLHLGAHFPIFKVNLSILLSISL